jgi:hypothetical protein
MMNETEFKIHLNNMLCQVANLLLHYYDPCQWKDGQCVNGKPWCCHNTNDERRDGQGGCAMLSESGCTVQSIGCKVWLCNEVLDVADSKLKRALKALEIISRIFGLSSFPTEHLLENGEYQTKDLLTYFND